MSAPGLCFVYSEKQRSHMLSAFLAGSDWGADLPNGNDNSSNKSKKLWKKKKPNRGISL